MSQPYLTVQENCNENGSQQNCAGPNVSQTGCGTSRFPACLFPCCLQCHSQCPILIRACKKFLSYYPVSLSITYDVGSEVLKGTVQRQVFTSYIGEMEKIYKVCLVQSHIFQTCKINIVYWLRMQTLESDKPRQSLISSNF